MGNSSPAARAAADWIAPPLSEDGAAVALEKYLEEKSSVNSDPSD
jgi:hydroxymethylpyrimidine pyrophosphatase-like HAD family hydrolase